jgi:hypothetical protein
MNTIDNLKYHCYLYFTEKADRADSKEEIERLKESARNCGLYMDNVLDESWEYKKQKFISSEQDKQEYSFIDLFTKTFLCK